MTVPVGTPVGCVIGCVVVAVGWAVAVAVTVAVGAVPATVAIGVVVSGVTTTAVGGAGSVCWVAVATVVVSSCESMMCFAPQSARPTPRIAANAAKTKRPFDDFCSGDAEATNGGDVMFIGYCGCCVLYAGGVPYA